MNLAEIELYPHNKVTYMKICEAWKSENKIAVIQATGTGKTFLILKSMSNFMFQKKLILAPSNYILDHIQASARGGDINTTYMTYTMLSLMSSSEIKELELSLIILDEFHRCGADVWGKSIVKLFDNFPNAKILGTSATPIRYLDNERNMADELFDGKIVSNLTLSDAIIKNILPMPKYISALYSLNEETDKLKKKINNSYNSKEEKDGLINEVDLLKRKLDKSNGIPSILKKYLNGEEVKKMIVFCRDVEHLEEMTEIVSKWFLETGICNGVEILKVYTGYLNSKKDFERFNGNNETDNILLLFCVDMLNEGIHVADINGVILLRTTFSPNIFYQQIGRAIQVSSNNSPFIFDFVNNFDNMGSNQFIEDLKESNENELKRNKQYIDVPSFSIYDEMQEAKTMFKNIEESLIESWDYWYPELCEFYNKNGHTIVMREKDNSNKLAMWVSKLREKFSHGKLDEEKVNKLNELNFVWNVYDYNWNKGYLICLDYKSEFGHLEPHSGDTYKDFDICQWINRQKTLKKEGSLSDERIKKLDDIGFIWSMKDKLFKENLTKLKCFKEKNGHFNLTRKDDASLYVWMCRMRGSYRKGALKDSYINDLEFIGFDLGIDVKAEKLKEIWLSRYNEYKDIVENKELKYVEKEENNKLWSWANIQRSKMKDGELKEWQIEKLDNIDFIWNCEGGRIIKPKPYKN